MKHTKSIALATCLVSLVPILTGCPGGGGGNNNSDPPPPNNGGGGNNALPNLNGVTITVTVTGGASPFISHGSYTWITTSGNGTSGNYQLSGSAGGPQSNVGTYTYSASGNIGTLTTVEQSGTLVNNTLTFTTTNSGTIYSSSPQGQGPRDVGGWESGNFTIN